MGTPTRSTFSLPTITETVKSEATRTAPVIANGHRDGRQAVMDDLGYSVPVVSMSYFTTVLLPPLREGLSVDDIITRLQQARHLNNEKRWNKLFKTPPSEAQNIESNVFREFEEIARLVRKAAIAALKSTYPGKDARPTTVFECNPDRTPESSTRNKSSKPDSYALLNPDHSFSLPPTVKGGVLWDDIVVPGEFKKRATLGDVNDNNIKMTCSMNHVMRESLRRRFVFGYTIEDVNMRLWYLNRSDALVSTHFNFITDCDTLVHFLLSIMFAQPADLGYDTTMRRVHTVCDTKKKQGEGAASQYDISVFYYSTTQTQPERRLTQRVYRTQRLVSNIGAEAPRGRGTRVWVVLPLDSQSKPFGPPKVLKDCWIDSDRTREGDILEQLRASAQTDAQKQELDRCFLTVDCHGDVHIDGKVDDTHSLLRRGLPVQQIGIYDLHTPVTVANVDKKKLLYPSGAIPPSLAILPANHKKTIDYDDKSHYRIVFNELGTSIDKVNSGFMIFRSLALTVPGLRAMHECGWVHRDISMGNLLVVDGRPKITDLEYAKRVDDDSKVHKTRTGTECFMPVEIKSQSYVFRPLIKPPTARPTDDEAVNVALAEALFDNHLLNSLKPSPPPPNPTHNSVANVRLGVRHNPIHDLEGFWWTSIILTIYRKLKDKISEGKELSPEDEAFYEFIGIIFEAGDPRRDSMTNDGYFATRLENIDPRLKSMAGKLEEARQLLVTAYVTAEQDIPSIDHTAARTTYVSFQKLYLEVATELASGGDVDFEPLNAHFVKPQEDAAPVYCGLSLDSRRAHLGKRTRDDAVVLTLAAEMDAIGLSSTIVKRAKRENSDPASHVSLPTAEEDKRAEVAGDGDEDQDEGGDGDGDDADGEDGESHAGGALSPKDTEEVVEKDD